ncbi:hypothetical protein I302_101909 [Kwoniella bestiolae CBS 10118]|uniref:AB hydrolase-1 domain-containing protein n=1 Tax=Kwoniella bestiolae CBS 10118 TaxID=1296100 RepID=A0A1B9GDJ4_9TREE|nr:hypothetical protein I302_00591 [Kwoniella bestiolae CBS 10118]OCF29099.1 hypothetical protein I302_00591 [Kwoniella bestiolae CBS 10118]
MSAIVRSTILFLDILPYLSISYLLSSGGQWLLNTQSIIQIPTNQYLLVFAIAETLFLIYSTLYTTYLTPPAVEGRTEITNEARRQLFDEVVSTLQGKDKKGVDEWLRRWFYVDLNNNEKKHFSFRQGFKDFFEEGKLLTEINDQEVKRGNVEELISGIFFNSPLSAVHSNPIHNHTLISMISRLELLRNFRFSSGYNTFLKPLCPSLNPVLVRSEYRPLLFYICMASCQRIFESVVWIFGFRRVRQGKMDGWFYSPSSPGMIISLCKYTIKVCGETWASDTNQDKVEEAKQPIIFIPGLAGPFFLTHLILNLIVLDRPILVIDQPHLSLKLRFTSRNISSLPELSNDIITFLERRGFAPKNGDGVAPMIVAHSLGSALASSLIRQISDTPDITAAGGDLARDRTEPHSKSNLKLILLDPISILLTHPHLSQTIYLPPTASGNNDREGAMDILIRYFIRENGMARFLKAEFNQFDSFFPVSHFARVIGKDNLKVILSERDHLLPIPEMIRYLTKQDVSHEVLGGVQHGLWLVDWRSYRRVWGCIRCMAESSLSDQEVDKKASTSSSINMSIDSVPVPLMSRNRSRSLLISKMIKLPSSTSPLKMTRMRSRTISISPQYSGLDYNDQQSMSRQCSSIGMNRTLNVSRFKRC